MAHPIRQLLAFAQSLKFLAWLPLRHTFLALLGKDTGEARA